MTRRLADYIANGKPKVAMLTDDSGYGEQGRKALRESFTVDEVEVVSDQVIPRRARDLAPQILAARQAGADRLVVWAAPPASRRRSRPSTGRTGTSRCCRARPARTR